ncbi:MAG: S9 family peptidase [Acidobacteriaceae bacterium]|nr:S9 family peptidase [Acidobacteriaceae bacterium]
MSLVRIASVFLSLALATSSWCLANQNASAKQAINETDLLKIQRVTEVRIAPDGSVAVYVVRSIHAEPGPTPKDDPAYSYRDNLWMVDLGDSAARPLQLTYGEENVSGLQISPDGHELAFLRADSKKHPQVWVMPLNHPGAPRMVTTLENGAEDVRWRPDGKALLVSGSIPLSKIPGKPTFDLERPGRDWWDFDRPPVDDPAKADPGKTAKENKPEDVPHGSPDGDLRSIRDWLEHNSAHRDPDDINRIAFLGELSLRGELEISELFRVDLGSEPKTTQLTSSFHDHDGAIFSPHGDRILFASAPPSHLHPDRLQNKSAIWEMNADGSNEHPILNDEKYAYRNPRFTPDARRLIVTAQQTDQPTYRQAMLAACDPDGANLVWLTPDSDPSVIDPQPSPDGHIYYTVEYHGGQPLRRVDLSTRKIEDVVAGPIGVNAFETAAGKLVYAQISAENPNELYLADTAREKARRLSDLNTGWLESKIISLPEEHWITRPDGTRVQYWVMKPINAQPGQRYPWVLDMHGGPAAMWGPGEFTMWHEFQIFCSFGYGVVYSNPRGSGGYGYAFERANYKNWGEGPMGDVMAALDDASANSPLIDKDRLFVTGGSYAGYLTAWVVGHTNRFKAAAALRGVYDLSTFFGEGNAFQLVPWEFGGYPWEPETRRLLDQQSPITYVSDIHTPLLIIHGSSDNRTGVVQGQMLFRALKELNRPVEYIRYPGVGHEITRSGPPQQRMDHMLRIIEFFERYSRNTHPAPAVETAAAH